MLEVSEKISKNHYVVIYTATILGQLQLSEKTEWNDNDIKLKLKKKEKKIFKSKVILMILAFL